VRSFIGVNRLYPTELLRQCLCALLATAFLQVGHPRQALTVLWEFYYMGDVAAIVRDEPHGLARFRHLEERPLRGSDGFDGVHLDVPPVNEGPRVVSRNRGPRLLATGASVTAVLTVSGREGLAVHKILRGPCD